MRQLEVFNETNFVMYSIDLQKSKRLLREYVDRYNEGKPLRQQLRANHMALVAELLEIYRVSLWRIQAEGTLLIPGCPLPYMVTNNVQLSNFLMCSDRSVQNLRHRLKAAQLITDEIWHGSNGSYEVQLNVAIVFLGKKGDLRNQIGLFGTRGSVLGAREDRCATERGLPYGGAAGNTTYAAGRPGEIGSSAEIASLSASGGGENEAAEMWKTGKRGVGVAIMRQVEALKNARYGENFSGRQANFSPYCTRLKLDTNKLNQWDPVECGKPANAERLPVNEDLRGTLAGYETISDIGVTAPPVAAAPPGIEMSRLGEAAKEGRHGAGGLAHGFPSVVSDISPKGEQCPDAVKEIDCALPPETFAEAVGELPDQLGRVIFREVSKVWEVALQELYAGEWIADTEKERAKARLAEYFIYAKPERYRAGTKEICERIILVRKWIQRGRQVGRQRWVPIPSVYFDYRNRRGFGRTKAWFKGHLENRRRIGDEVALARAVREYGRILENPGEVGPMEVYRQLEAGLMGRGIGLVERFKATVDDRRPLC